MSEQNYIYAPGSAIDGSFKCKVPMKGTRQLFIVDGKPQGSPSSLTVKYAQGERPSEALQVIGVRTSAVPGSLSFSTSYHFGQDSVGRLILCSHTFAEDSFETTENCSIVVEKGASVEVVLMQNEHNRAAHFLNMDVVVGENGSFKATFISLNGGHIENRINVKLEREGAYCELNGLYLADGTQNVRNIIRMEHLVPGCHSKQLFKGILDNNANSRFSGLIKVCPGAFKTEAYQENHNLLLTKGAVAVSEPMLEIYADDVKCSHGATNGRLNEDELFYMRSRGISLKEASLLQQMAFAYSVLEKISTQELRERMMSLTEQRLRGEFSDCRKCCKNCC